MDSFDTIREMALALHEKLVASGVDPLDCLAMASAGVADVGYELAALPAGDVALKGARALIDEQSQLICFEDVGTAADRAQLIAHELGHACGHAGSCTCATENIDPSRSTEAAAVGLQRVEDYGVRERRELQANVFAREFLLPKRLASRLYLAEGGTALAIATRTGLPLNLVRQQLFDALLLPDVASVKRPSTKGTAHAADPSQLRAASHRGAPYQLQAGPGTGKTRTLVDRICSLVREGVDPASILVLTFSNRAAGELVERLAQSMPAEATRIWAGTFHAFGLDIVRRYHDRLGLTANPTLFDRSDTIEALEEAFPTLPLKHHRSIFDPSIVLGDVLTAVSRAKDELVDAARYRALGEAMLSSAAGDEDRACAAEKCIEVSTVYAAYERLLVERDAVDFGDLLMRPVALLRADESVWTALQLRYHHVLVDEYQDVNYASAQLLKAIAGDGKRLWVVGDTRQSIYRFRGASASNMAAFSREYGGAVVEQLAVNYRSTKEVVDTFVAIAPRMGASSGMPPLALRAERGGGGPLPEILPYDRSSDELAGVAASVKELQSRGVRFADQAVLCRSNARLDATAAALERRGIPCLYLGSLFERREVRDLLSLLSFVVDPFGDALTRVGAMPRYGLSLQDVFEVTKRLRDGKRPVVEQLRELVVTPDGPPATAHAGLSLLAQDLAGASVDDNAWELLSTYLLDRTDVVRRLSSGSSVEERVRAIAVWQFLNFVRDQRPAGKGLPIQKVLRRIRQLVLLGEDRELRDMPDAALGIDAVRLMTVHKSKGLEFDAVHVPGLNVASFPSSPKWQRCPPPAGLVATREGISSDEDAKASKRLEEECLFFVAVSRARTHLRLYLSAKHDGGRSQGPSEFLEWIPKGRRLDRTEMPRALAGPDATDSVISVRRRAKLSVSEGNVRAYEKCPRRYFYTHVLRLGSGRRATPFGRTEDCLYDFLRALAEERGKGELSLEALEALFELQWQKSGPRDHPYASDYRSLASRLIRTLHASGQGRRFRAGRAVVIEFGDAEVVIVPSEVADGVRGNAVVRRVRLRSKKSKEYEDDLNWALYAIAAEQDFGPGATVEAVHLDGGTVELVDLTKRKVEFRREKVAKLLAAMNAGEYPPLPETKVCAACPHFFLCDAAPAGALRVD